MKQFIKWTTVVSGMILSLNVTFGMYSTNAATETNIPSTTAAVGPTIDFCNTTNEPVLISLHGTDLTTNQDFIYVTMLRPSTNTRKTLDPKYSNLKKVFVTKLSDLSRRLDSQHSVELSSTQGRMVINISDILNLTELSSGEVCSFLTDPIQYDILSSGHDLTFIV